MCKTLDKILMWIVIVLMPFQIRIWNGIKMEIRIRIKTTPIQNNAFNRLLLLLFNRLPPDITDGQGLKTDLARFSKLIFRKELACMKKKSRTRSSPSCTVHKLLTIL